MVPRNENKRGRRKKEDSNETRAALDTSNSCIGHGRFPVRSSDDQKDYCLPGERGKPGRKC